MDLGGMNLNPQDLLQYLQGINWPANKQEVVSQAENNGAPQDLLDQLKSLEGGRYSGPEEVVNRLGSGG